MSTTIDAGAQALETLQSQWYNTLVASLGLDATRFQLLEPTAPLGPTSDQLWAYFNDLPPSALTNVLGAGGGNRFYDDYVAVVSQLQSQQGSAFRMALGDSYDAWQTYVGALTPAPTIAALPDVFRSWAAIHAPEVAAKGGVAFAALLNDPIYLAQIAATETSQFVHGVPNFSKTIADLTTAVASGAAHTIDFDSRTASSDVTKTWAGGSVGGAYEFFTGSGSTSYSSSSSKAATSQVTITGTIAHAVTFAADPGSWYRSAALGMAYNTSDNTLWSHGTPNWESTFGPTGNMLRFVASLVVVDGIDLTLTSDASFDTDEQQAISASASVGIWPFFSFEASGGHSTAVSFDSSGSMTVKVSSPAGNPAVLGANVVPVEKYLGGN